MPFGSGRKGAAEWADIEIESDKLKFMRRHCTALIGKITEKDKELVHI